MFNKEKFRDLRKKKGFTQESLAVRLRTTKGTVSNYENGHSTPDDEMLAAIANTLNTTSDYLLDLSNESSPISKPANMPPEWIRLYDQIHELGMELEATAILRTAAGMSKETLEDVLKMLKHVKSKKDNQ